MKTFFINMLLLFTATLSFAQVPNYVPTNGLVGWWPFNGNANDESGNGNNGTVNGATLTTDRNGLANKAYSFDGVNDFINLNTSFTTGSTSKSFSVWFNLQDTSYHWIISGGTSANSQSFGLFWNRLPQVSTNKLTFHGDGITYDFEFSNIILNTWNNVVISFSSDTVKANLNGNFIGSKKIILNTTSSSVRIGCRNNSTAYFKGKIDDIGIWNRALTQCEISNLYNAQVGTTNSITQSSCNSFTLNNQTYTQSGTYTQNLTNAAGCDSIITLNLTINNSPTASGSSTGATFHGATDGTVNLTVSGGASPYSFSWSNGVNTEDLNAVGAGTYNVTITDANNCTATSTVTVNQPPLSLVKSPESIISSALYPNPATALTRLDLQLSSAQDFEVAVYNNLGQRLFNKNFSNTKELSENIDMRSWPAGQYFVEIKLPNGKETKKLIKE